MSDQHHSGHHPHHKKKTKKQEKVEHNHKLWIQEYERQGMKKNAEDAFIAKGGRHEVKEQTFASDAIADRVLALQSKVSKSRARARKRGKALFR